MENLCDLPYDVLVEIAKRLKKFEDFTCFRSVSKLLRGAAKAESFEGLLLRQRTPYLMLPVRDSNDDIREFYSLVEGESIVASVKFPKIKSKKCFESLGWLLTVEVDGSMSLLNPFSGTEIPLPHQTTFPEYAYMDEHVFIKKMVLSSRPSETSDFVVMVIYGGCSHLGFWRLGDKAWSRIESRKGAYTDVVYYGGGQFYAIGYPGNVWVFNLSGEYKHVEDRMIARCKHIVPYNLNGANNLYVMKTVGDSLYIIIRTALKKTEDENDLSCITSKFQVYEVNIATGKLKVIHSLGSMAVFLGHNSTTAVDASKYPGGVIKANHIYFTDDDWEYYYFYAAEGGGMDIGVYSLETKTIEPIYPGELLLSKVSPSTWITPCF